MGSIVGAGVKISHAKKKRAKSKATGRYLDRNKALPYLGYADYRDYLRSSDWKIIRKAKLESTPMCECCGVPAKYVHHYCYDSSVLLGLYPQMLFSICNKCHEDVEFSGKDEKRPVAAAQFRLREILASKGNTARLAEIEDVYRDVRKREKAATQLSMARRRR